MNLTAPGAVECSPGLPIVVRVDILLRCRLQRCNICSCVLDLHINAQV